MYASNPFRLIKHSISRIVKLCFIRMWSRFFFTPEFSLLQKRQIRRDSSVVFDGIEFLEFSESSSTLSGSFSLLIDPFISLRKSEETSWEMDRKIELLYILGFFAR